ncbi:MAG: hypothetical protein FD131_4325 [Rhodocyclaceae bacterium]|nr:MAG: hypothetical protein FD131_4325 [Rhodocyclaceae bacterium]
MAASRFSGPVASTGQYRSLRFRYRWMLRIAEMAKANRPVPCRADVRMGPPLWIELRHTMEALELLGQGNRGGWNIDHGRTLSNTRPKNQKFSTPAHKA